MDRLDFLRRISSLVPLEEMKKETDVNYSFENEQSEQRKNGEIAFREVLEKQMEQDRIAMKSKK